MVIFDHNVRNVRRSRLFADILVVIAGLINGKVDTHWRHGGCMKDAGMRIRVEQELRDAFVAACQKLDVPAAQVLRQHMKAVVEKVGKAETKTQVKAKQS